MGPLVSTAELAAHLADWRTFDCRHDLMKPELGAQQYKEAHIPGALFASLDHDLSAPKTGKNGRHPLPHLDAFVRWLGTEGLRHSDQIVCYDAANGSTAARLWWMLRWAGHKAVAVLDGGLAKWLKEGRPVDAIVPRPQPTTYPGKKSLPTLDAAALDASLASAHLVDARAPARWRGEQEPIDPEAGRIPGARNRFNMENLQPDGTFKPSEQLKLEWEAALGGAEPG